MLPITILSLFNTLTTVVAETTGEQLERLLIAPLLNTAQLADDNHVVSVDLRLLTISLIGDVEQDLSSCSVSQQNFSQSGSESVQSGYDSDNLSPSFRVSEWGLFGLFASSWLIYWSQKSHSLFWEGHGCSFRFDAPRECWIIYLASSLVSTAAFGGVGGFGTELWNGWKDHRDGKKRRAEAERMGSLDAHYEALEKTAGLLDSEGLVLLSSTGYHGHVSEKGSGLVVRKNCLTWKDGNKTRIELFEPGMGLQEVTDMLKEKRG